MSRPSKHSPPGAQLAERNLRFGWWSLLIFLSLGAVLEMLHGFKIGWYVDVGNETRRLMFTLAHAHGTLLAVVNIAAGLTVRIVDRFTLRPSVSFALIWAAILLPAGFFLGGIVIYDGDPGLGVWLVPIGAVLLFYSIARIALDLSRRK
jgi:membrane protein DedA with SNARE-associated domain